ncbi:helix-turn-helix domain-containing protein [Amycolatopsis sp. NBC_00348]|uniref:helix-turn-helix domain-containing protein n=1 Tax=Amycolatopsis sp. NBC_00348 TaxID=2975956 RepID=UPI002E26D29E
MVESFGEALRKLRQGRGLSLDKLARKISYSKSYLSKIENGMSAPTADIAKRCDSALETGGALVTMIVSAKPEVPKPRPEAANGDEGGDDEVWVMVMDTEGTSGFHRLPRRQVLAGLGIAVGYALTGGAWSAADPTTIAGLHSAFDQYRKLGTTSRPGIVLPQVVAHVHTVRSLAGGAVAPEVRDELLVHASRAAEYAGWMSQEAGDDRAAAWWTAKAVDFAASGGDLHLGVYALVRQAELALYQQDSLATVELAVRAQTDPSVGSRILGLAARCEAQGHALAGAPDDYLRALERARVLLSEGTPLPASRPVFGSASVVDEVALAEGWSLYDLGRPADAAEVLDRELPRIAAEARRARARFGARHALAHAGNGEIEHACSLTRGVLEDAAHVDSATVRIDLRQLSRTLARWHNHPAVRELLPELGRALRVVRVPPA